MKERERLTNFDIIIWIIAVIAISLLMVYMHKRSYQGGFEEGKTSATRVDTVYTEKFVPVFVPIDLADIPE